MFCYLFASDKYLTTRCCNDPIELIYCRKCHIQDILIELIFLPKTNNYSAILITITIVLAIHHAGNKVCCDGHVGGSSDCHKVKL